MGTVNSAHSYGSQGVHVMGGGGGSVGSGVDVGAAAGVAGTSLGAGVTVGDGLSPLHEISAAAQKPIAANVRATRLSDTKLGKRSFFCLRGVASDRAGP
jgi:hypothetical protein